MSQQFQPRPDHKFTFGLWTVGNIGRAPFGEPVRRRLSPAEIVHLLAEVGAYRFNLHDNDLVPIDATPAEGARIVKDFAWGCMRTYLILKDKAAQWNADAENRPLLAEINQDDGSMDGYKGVYGRAKADALKAASFDRQALGARGLN